MAPCHFLNKWRFNVNLAYFDIRICVGLWSVCCRFVIGLSSGLSVCCWLRFQYCANDGFSVGAMSVIYRSQIGRFDTESYPKWPRHEPDWFYGVLSNIVGGRQLADSLKMLRFLSVSCRYGRCDWGIRGNIIFCNSGCNTKIQHICLQMLYSILASVKRAFRRCYINRHHMSQHIQLPIICNFFFVMSTHN